jgi:hypothetical protein
VVETAMTTESVSAVRPMRLASARLSLSAIFSTPSSVWRKPCAARNPQVRYSAEVNAFAATQNGTISSKR